MFDDTTHTEAPLPRWARGVRRLVVLSGAGISTDSGIGDFRGKKGAWTLNPGAQHRNTYRGFLTDPELRAGYWKSRFEHPWHAKPNAAHLAVTELARSGIDTTIVTQNTDGLHQQAGTPPERVVELHGTMNEVMCVDCDDRTPTAETIARIAAGDPVPACLRCGGILKTASTMFGQTMPPEVHHRAEEAALECDLLLAVGTSLTVEPGASLCARAVRAGAPLVIVNWDPTPYDGIATELIRDPIGTAMPRIAAQLIAGAELSRNDPARPRPARASDGTPGPRPSRLLRPEARTARWRDGEGRLEELVAWSDGPGARTRLVHGPDGAGKSRLALELADRLAAGGDWEIAFPARDAQLPVAGDRPLLCVVEDAETRQPQLAEMARSGDESSAPVRVLLLARTAEGWREPDSSDLHLDGDPGDAGTAVDDYAAVLTAPSKVDVAEVAGDNPGHLQASALAALLGGAGPEVLVDHELAYLCDAAAGLGLDDETIIGAAVTAMLCGAADEEGALAALSELPGLADPEVRERVARWLREQYPSSGTGYWDDTLPAAVEEDLIAGFVTPRFLLLMVSETNPQQDRRTLTVLSRAAETRPRLRAGLIELLSVLPGLSPATVDAALTGGHPGPLADAMISLARNAALPAELLAEVPPGNTMFGEFPVLLAQSLVEAYEGRVAAYPGSAPRGLAQMLVELSGRLADLGRVDESLAAARRAVEVADGLTEKHDLPERSDAALRRATALAAAR